MILFVPALFIDVLPDRFYRIRDRYSLYLLFQAGFLTLLVFLIFQDMFPMLSSVSFFGAFSWTLQLDGFNTLFLISFSVTLFILLLSIKENSRRQFLWPLISIYLIILSGDTGTFFITSLIYFITIQLNRKKTFNIITFLPLFLIITAYFLFNILNSPGDFSIPINESSAVIPVSGSVLYFILSAFFLPVFIKLTDMIYTGISGRKGIIELILSVFAVIYAIHRLTGSMINPHVTLMYWLIISAVLLCVLALLLFYVKHPEENSFIPFMLTFLLIYILIFMSLRIFPVNTSVLRLQKEFLYSIPLYMLVIILFQDVYSTIKDDFSRFMSFFIFIAALFLNPWFSLGKVFAYTVIILLNHSLAGLILFSVFIVVSMFIAGFLLLNEKSGREAKISFPCVLFIFVSILLVAFETGVSL